MEDIAIDGDSEKFYEISQAFTSLHERLVGKIKLLEDRVRELEEEKIVEASEKDCIQKELEEQNEKLVIENHRITEELEEQKVLYQETLNFYERKIESLKNDMKHIQEVNMIVNK